MFDGPVSLEDWQTDKWTDRDRQTDQKSRETDVDLPDHLFGPAGLLGVHKTQAVLQTQNLLSDINTDLTT